MCNYKEQIEALLDSFIKNSELNINKDIVIEGRVPTSVSSEFITNKEQGDWAENLVFQVINSSNSNYIAVHYGKDDDISAGDPGFKEFYEKYQDELNTIGKRPDILIFKRQDIQKK